VVIFSPVRYQTKENHVSPGVAFFFTCLALSATALISLIESPTHIRLLSLFLGFEGTALLASVILNSLLAPPDGADIWEWLFVPQGRTVSVIFKEPLFYLGVTCLVLQENLGGWI